MKGISDLKQKFNVESIHGVSEVKKMCFMGLFNKKSIFYLLNELHSFDGIIGFDFLKSINANINLATDTLHYDGGAVKIYYSKCRKINFLEAIPNDVPNDFREDFLHALETRAKVFADISEKLPYNTNVVATIRTTDDEPVYVKAYPYPMAVADFVNKEVAMLLDNGIIRESRSPYNNPIWVVDKKGTDEEGNKNLRMVTDFKKLNEKTVSDKYPIPDISVILSNLGMATYFSTIDLKSGFHQILLKEEDREKTAFSVNNGKYEFCRLQFGLKNAPSIFQRALDDILREFIGKICHVYIDDVIIFSKTPQEHIKHIGIILDALYRANMRVSAQKSKFFKKEVEYLGFVVSAEGIKTCPSKIKDILNFVQPTTLRSLRSFLGLAGYYRRFIKDYAAIAKPLTKYLRGENGHVGTKQSKNVRITFDEGAISAFEKIKNILASEDTLLLYPDFRKPFDLTTDASSHAIGAVLSQNGRPITMISRTLSSTEESFATNERELLAIVWSFQKLRNYLYGASHINVFTDHQPLAFSMSEKNPNMKLKRWRAFIEEFSPRFFYKPGKENVVADAFSRQQLNFMSVSSCVNSEESSSNIIPSVSNPVNCFRNQIIITSSSQNKKTTKILFKNQLRHTLEFRDIDSLFQMIKHVVNPSVSNGVHCELPILGQIQNHLVTAFPSVKFKFSKYFVMDVFNQSDQMEILLYEHNRAHRSLKENKNQVLRDYFFPTIQKQLREIISNCKICKEAKYSRHPLVQRIGQTPIPSRPGEILHVDIFNTDKHYFLTCIDKFSKFAVVHPISSRSIVDLKVPLINTLNLFENTVTVVCDNEKAFCSETIKTLLKNQFNAKLFTIPPAHSISNGQIERFHSTLTEISRCTKLESAISDTIELIAIATAKYNRSIHSVTNKKPIEIFSSLSPEERLEIRKRLEKAQQQELRFHNKKRTHRHFEAGDKVFVKTNKRIGNKFRKLYLEKVVEEDLGNVLIIDGREVHKDNIR